MGEYPRTITPALSHGRRRTRSRSARLTRLLAVLMIAAGALAVADGIVTLLWQEPISALIANAHQDELSGELSRVERAAPSVSERRTLDGIATERRRIAYLAADFERHARNGAAVGRIVIPKIGASFVVVKGTGTAELESGPGIYPATAFPALRGTTAIAGHRTTYLAPFRQIDSLHAGNRILLKMPYAHFTYTVTSSRIVAPTDVRAAVAEVGYPRLVLSACTPLFSAEKRLLVYARLTRTQPAGAALKLGPGVSAEPIVTPLHPERSLPPMLKTLGPQVQAAVSL